MKGGRAKASAVSVLGAVLALLVTAACEPIPTAPGTRRVVVFGDSIPFFVMREGRATTDLSRWTLVDGTLVACDGAKGNPPARTGTGDPLPTSKGCDPGWPSLFPPHLTITPDVAVVMTGQHAMLDRKLDGVWRHPCHTPYRTWYQADFEARIRYVASMSASTVVILPAWSDEMSRWIMPADHVKRADCVRNAMRAAAKAVGGVTVVDFGAFLCPEGPAACLPWRAEDGIHIDEAHAGSVLTWLMDAVDPAPAPDPDPA